MSKQQEALQLLDDLDSFAAPPPPSKISKPSVGKSKAPAAPPAAGNEKEVLAFLDEITQKSSEPRKSTSSLHAPTPPTVTRVTLSGSSPRPGTPSRKSVDSMRNSPKPDAAATHTSAPGGDQSGAGGGWGWGSVWGSASAVIQTARAKVDEQVKNLPQNEQARKWGEGMMEYVKQAQLDKIGQELASRSLSTLTGLMNVVAPPISEHEVIQVWLSHDMEGYDGVESLVYRAFARVLEQIEGGDLVVNKGNESRKKEQESSGTRNLNAVIGIDSALKLADVEVNELIKIQASSPATPTSTIQNPTTYSPVYLRIQPFTSSIPSVATIQTAGEEPEPPKETLQFVLHLVDPDHQLIHTQVTQSVPASWLDLWDEDETGGRNGKKNGDWIEDFLVEIMRVAVEIVGQEYVVARMGWAKTEKGKAKEEEESEEEEDDEEESEEE